MAGFVVLKKDGKAATDQEKALLDCLFGNAVAFQGRRTSKQAIFQQIKCELENQGFVFKPIDQVVPRNTSTCTCIGAMAVADEAAEVDWVTLRAVLENER